jgi:hypothetical protein
MSDSAAVTDDEAVPMSNMDIKGEALRVIGACDSYETLLLALRTRWESEGFLLESAAEICGLPSRFLGKIFGPNAPKKLTFETLFDVVQGFGCRLLLVEDKRATKQFSSRIQKRDPRWIRPVTVHFTMTNRRWAQIRKLGSQKRWEGKSKEERRDELQRVLGAHWRRGERGNGNGNGRDA